MNLFNSPDTRAGRSNTGGFTGTREIVEPIRLMQHMPACT